jgi:hypothetical protein
MPPIAWFYLGVAVVGVGIGIYFLVKRAKKTTNYEVPPSAQPFFDCVMNCGNKHGFDTEEFYKCVERCILTSRSKPDA